MKLLIRNLARSTTEAELRELFESYGPVQSCTLVMDKKTGGSKGFGFIEMPKAGDAKAAMKNLNGKDIAGSKIRVKKAQDKPEPTSSPQQPASSEPDEQPKPLEQENKANSPWQRKK
jgi:RNA recognition motif-containing protein